MFGLSDLVFTIRRLLRPLFRRRRELLIHPLDECDGQRLMILFRERLFARLLERHAISELLVTKLKAWRQPGFSALVGKPIPPQDQAAIEDIAAYLVRPPLSLEKLVYLDGERAVLYRSKPSGALRQPLKGRHRLELYCSGCPPPQPAQAIVELVDGTRVVVPLAAPASAGREPAPETCRRPVPRIVPWRVGLASFGDCESSPGSAACARGSALARP